MKYRFILILAWVFLYPGLVIQAEIISVGNKPLPHHSIQEAVAVANSGDIIQVEGGFYREDILLDKQVQLIGIGKPVIHGSGTKSVIQVLAEGCTIQGFVIEHSGKELQKEDSGILVKSNDNRIIQNVFQDILFGIYLFQSQNNILAENTIRGRKELDMGDRGAAIHLWNSPENRIESNIISETRDGLFIQNSPGNVIKNNDISHLRYGVHYMFSDSNRFEQNTFSDNLAGAALMYSKNILFQRNRFIRNRGYGSFGILFQECIGCIAEENLILDNTTGVFMEAVRESQFRNNIIAENDLALEIFSSCSSNTFTGNYFVNNLSPLQVVGKATATRWEENGRGNYWSDYDGYDLDEDGIGDVAYKIQNIFEYMEGNHPRLRIYFSSTAAQALAAADKAFPVFEGSHEKDLYPLVNPVKRTMASQTLKESTEDRQYSLGLFSAATLGMALAVLWRGQRR